MIGSTPTKYLIEPKVCVPLKYRILWFCFGLTDNDTHNRGWNSLTVDYWHLCSLIDTHDRLNKEYHNSKNNRSAKSFSEYNKRICSLKWSLGRSLYVRCVVPLPNILTYERSIKLDMQLVGKYYKMSAETMPPVVLGYGDEDDPFCVIDGLHRLEAANRRGDKAVAVFKPFWLSLNKISF